MNTNGIGNTYAQAVERTGKNGTSQREIGSPNLSERAQKYYDQLKKKYSNMDFILVSEDQKNQAEANVGKYASDKELIVLIDEDKIEKMAADESYRKKYEGILSNATSQLSQMKDSLGSSADAVKSFGMKFNDNGTASFFAVIDKSLAAQRERIEEKASQNLDDRRKARRQEWEDRVGRPDSAKGRRDEDSVTVEASSWEELKKKIEAMIGGIWGDSVRSEQESWIGQGFDSTI